MTSIRHNTERGPEEDYLDAARETILAVGWRRTTLTDVAKRAGVSRMTIYRRWPDMQALLADLLVREWGGLLESALAGSSAPDRAAIVEGVLAAVTELRANPLLRKIVDVDPELLLPYLLRRRGRNQDLVLGVLGTAIAAAQQAGDVRAGDPGHLARALLLALQGHVLSVGTMVDDTTSQADVDRELRTLIDRYLAP
jgi:AcrR family transcriptional regulator